MLVCNTQQKFLLLVKQHFIRCVCQMMLQYQQHQYQLYLILYNNKYFRNFFQRVQLRNPNSSKTLKENLYFQKLKIFCPKYLFQLFKFFCKNHKISKSFLYSGYSGYSQLQKIEQCYLSINFIVFYLANGCVQWGLVVRRSLFQGTNSNFNNTRH